MKLLLTLSLMLFTTISYTASTDKPASASSPKPVSPKYIPPHKRQSIQQDLNAARQAATGSPIAPIYRCVACGDTAYPCHHA